MLVDQIFEKNSTSSFYLSSQPNANSEFENYLRNVISSSSNLKFCSSYISNNDFDYFKMKLKILLIIFFLKYDWKSRKIFKSMNSYVVLVLEVVLVDLLVRKDDPAILRCLDFGPHNRLDICTDSPLFRANHSIQQSDDSRLSWSPDTSSVHVRKCVLDFRLGINQRNRTHNDTERISYEHYYFNSLIK